MDWSQLVSLAGTYGASGGSLLALGYLFAQYRKSQKALKSIEAILGDGQLTPDARLAGIRGILSWAKVDPTA